MKVILIVGDIATVVACLGAAYLIRYSRLVPFPWLAVLILLGLTHAGLAWSKLYKRFMFFNRTEQVASIIKTTIGVAVIYIFLSFLWHFEVWEPSRIVAGIYFALFLPAALFMRVVVYRKLFSFLYRNGILKKQRVLVYDAANEHPGPKRGLGARQDIIGYELVGDYSGPVKDLKKLVAVLEPDKVIFFSGAPTYEALYKDLRYGFGLNTDFSMVAKLLNPLNISADVEKLGENSVVWFTNGRNGHGRVTFERSVKRFIDVVGAAFGIVVGLPVMLLISLGIKLTSRGPIIFRQRRFTEDGKPFTFLKFRTMVDGVSPAAHRDWVSGFIRNDDVFKRKKSYKMEKDERITPFGNVLRKTSLDELPQLFNILKGDMSLVGPRPPVEYEVKLYQDWHRDRLRVKQGLTGPWQVYGRSALPFDATVFLDLYYVHNQSLLMDLDLIFRTVPAVLRGKGAA